MSILHAELLRTLIDSESANVLDFLRKRLNRPSASRDDLDAEYQFLTRLLRSDKSFSLSQFNRLNDLIGINESELIRFRAVQSGKKNVVGDISGRGNNIAVDNSEIHKNSKDIATLKTLLREVMQNQQILKSQLDLKDEQIKFLQEQNQKLIDKLL